jgi:hypothetical protein
MMLQAYLLAFLVGLCGAHSVLVLGSFLRRHQLTAIDGLRRRARFLGRGRGRRGIAAGGLARRDERQGAGCRKEKNDDTMRTHDSSRMRLQDMVQSECMFGTVSRLTQVKMIRA